METNNYIVYRHTFPNGKVYIGITGRGSNARWKNGKGYRKQEKVFNAILFYGWQNIKHDVLFTGLSKAEAEAKEIELIKQYDSVKNGYNADNGGSTYGFHSDETKRKISKAHKGMPVSEKTRKKISEANSGEKNGFYGKHHTDEVKAEHAAFMVGNQYAKGLRHTDAFKAWKSEQMHEKYKDGGNPRCKRVVGTDEYGNIVEYASLRIAAKEVGACPATMYKHVHEGTPFGGYYWSYSE